MSPEISDRLLSTLIACASEVLGAEEGFITADTQFGEVGFDSITLTALSGKLNEAFGLDVDPTVFFEYPRLGDLAAHLLERRADFMRKGKAAVRRAENGAPAKGARRRNRRAQPPSNHEHAAAAQDAGGLQPVAVIGVSGCFPQSPGIDALWSNLVREKCCVGPPPEDRAEWRAAAAGANDGHAPSYMGWGGFVDGLAEFDPSFFGISPREAEVMDPQQRLLMMHAWNVIEDAGYSAASLAGTRTAVFLGAGGGAYAGLVARSESSAHGLAATSASSLSPNRISYHLDLRGPSEAVVTACSSSLVAIHRAILAIAFDRCTMAIVGGVNTMPTPEGHVMFGAAGMLSDDGLCKTFSANANGYVRGEGAGLLLLKKLDDAERDGDHIYAVIRGSAQNHGGRANSLTAPNPKAQAEVLVEAYRRAGVDPRTVGYVEAHGTGTALGDPIEVGALLAAFKELYATTNGPACERPHCGLGSIKSNIGHLEVAAGIAGVIKVLLQLQRKTLVKTLHSEPMNPYIRLDGSPFYIVRETQPWEPILDVHGKPLPRRAGVSSFGIGGVNAHVVIEEHVDAAPRRCAGARPSPVTIVLSAAGAERLQARAEQLLRTLDAGDLHDADLPDIAYTLQVGRQPMQQRLAFVSATLEEARQKLRAFLSQDAAQRAAASVDVGSVRRDDAAAAPPRGDAAVEEALLDACARGDYASIAALWVNGHSLDWQRLYPAARPRRMSLPAYPFERCRYWVAEQCAGRAAPRTEPTSSATEESGRTWLLESTWRLQPLPASADVATDAAETHREHWVMLATEYEQHGVALRESARVDVESLGAGSGTPLERIAACGEQVVKRLQAILGSESRRPVLLQVVVPLRATEEWPLSALIGLLRSARQESARLECQTIALDSVASTPDLLEVLIANGRVAHEDEIRYRDGQREVRRLEELPRTAGPAGNPPWKKGGVYLITGGAGGLGRILAEEIARSIGDVRILLIGRSTLTQERHARLRALERYGARVEYREVDVTDEAAVHAYARSVIAAHGKLDGVLHAAGVVDDRLLLKKTPAELRAVLAPKIVGTANVDRATAAMPLDFFILFSSVAAVLGNAGQTDYALANASMDRYALHRAELVRQGTRSGRTLVVNWPLWAEGGMTVHDAVLAQSARSGFYPLATRDGIDALYRAYASGRAHVAVLRARHGAAHALLDRSDHATSSRSAALAAGALAAGALAAGAPAAKKALGERMLVQLRAALAELTKIPVERIDTAEALESYGVDSIMLAELHRKLAQALGGLSRTVFFEFTTLEALRDHLVDARAASCAAWVGMDTMVADPAAAAPPRCEQRPAPPIEPRYAPGRAGASGSRAEPIAVIGMSGRFPQASTLQEYWENLKAGKDCIEEIPADRWTLADFYVENRDEAIARGKSCGKWGGFLRDVARYDPLFFNISPREAASIDSQELLFLEVAWNLLEEAAYTKDGLRRFFQSKVGVYVGATHGHVGAGERARADGAIAAISARSAIANRVSHFFDLKGPSIAIDTMCSSAAMAVIYACKDLLLGDCALAIAGGVNLAVHPLKYIGLSRTHMLGSSSDSRTFGSGDGYIPAEGVGALLLKPLSRAVEDGDRVLAVIKSAVASHSGHASAYLAPNASAQADLVEQCLARAGIDPRTIGYVEVAGSGSAAADASEVRALSKAFGKHTAERGFCAIGSAKASIGHAEAASAMSQLTKVVLQLQHKQLVPTRVPARLNPDLDLDNTPFRLQSDLRDWERPSADADPSGVGAPRRALVNSFGAGGSYASILLEEYDGAAAAAAEPAAASGVPQVAVFSARTPERLQVLLHALRAHLQRQTVSLTDLAYTLQTGRWEMAARLAVVAASVEEVVDGVDAYLGACARDQSPPPSGAIFFADLNQPSDTRRSLLRALTETALAAIVSGGAREHMAWLWTQGVRIPWDALPGFVRGRRISLPTYPFARRHVASEEPDAEPQSHGSAVESTLRRRIAECLGIRPDEVHGAETLADLGISSITAVRLQHALAEDAKREIPLSVLGFGRAIAEIESDLRAICASAAAREGDATERVAGDAYPQIVARPQDRYEPFPLTDMQESFLVGRRLRTNGDSVGAHVYFETETKALDIHRLNVAWNRLVAHHDMLRAMVSLEGQRVLKDVALYRFKVVDLRRRSETQEQADVAATRSQMSERVYEEGRWPLFDVRISVCRDAYVIHFSIDELIVDGMGLALLLRQWQRLYERPEEALPPLAVSFRDYVLAQKSFESSERFRADLRYWLAELADLPPGPSIAAPRPGARDDGLAQRVRLAAVLERDKWDRLKGVAARCCVSPTALLLTVFSEVLRAWSGDERFSLLLTLSRLGPAHLQLDDMVAPLMTTGIFLVDAPAGRSIEQLIRDNQRRLWLHLEHGSASGVRILRELKARGKSGHTVSLPVVFTTFLHKHAGEQGGASEDGALFWQRGHRFGVNQTPQVDLDHQATERAGRLELSWDVSIARYGAESSAALFAAYCDALHALADGSAVPHIEQVVAPVVRARERVRAASPPADAGEARARQAIAVVPSPEQRYEPFPLTDLQEAYAFGRSRHARGGGYTARHYTELDVASFDLGRLEDACRALVDRHEMLRTRILGSGHQQLLQAAPAFGVKVADLAACSATDGAAALALAEREMTAHVDDLESWPYLNVRVSLLEGGAARIHIAIDMLIADGRSIGLLLRELLERYADPRAEWPPIAVTFRDYVMALRRYRETPAYREDLDYWRRKCAELPEGPRLLLAGPALSKPDAGEVDRFAARLAGADSLQTHAARIGASLNAVLLAAYMEVLAAWSGQQPFTVAVPCWRRLPVHPQIDEVVGDFTAMSWVVRTGGRRAFEELVRDHDRALRADLAHRAVNGLTVLRRALGRRPQTAPTFPVVFTEILTDRRANDLPGGFKRVRSASATPQVYLDNIGSIVENVLDVQWHARRGVYGDGLVADMFAGYCRLLQALVDDVDVWRTEDLGDLLRVRSELHANAGDGERLPP